MFILSLIFTEFLVLSAIFFRLYYYSKKADCTYNHITIGIGPIIYTKNYNGTNFIFKLIPLFVNYDFKDYDYNKLKNINDLLTLSFSLLIIAIPHSIIVLLFGGTDLWYIFYKTLIIGSCSEAELTVFDNILEKVSVNHTVFFLIAVFSTALVYSWYILVLRSIIDFVLKKLANLLNFSFNSTNLYLASTAIILYIYFTGNVIVLLLIFQYNSLIFGLIDWLIANFVLMAVFALILEILSRRQINKIEN